VNRYEWLTLTELANSTEWSPCVIMNKSTVPKAQLPIGVIIMWITKWTNGDLVTSCLEQGTKSTVKKTRNFYAGCIVIHAVNTDLVIMPGGISHNYILVNKPFKNHLKQLYSEWPLAGHYVLTPTGPIRKPSIELLCQWIKFMAGNRSLQKR
jgi:hypothetical protein